MTDEQIIKALECCNDGACEYCPIGGDNCIQRSRNEAIKLINHQKAEIERLQKFKYYFDDLYGLGLEIANWHHNGMLEPFDNFYDSAIKEMVGD